MASGLKSIYVRNVNTGQLVTREARHYYDGTGAEYLTYPRDSFYTPAAIPGWNWNLLSGHLGIGFWLGTKERS